MANELGISLAGYCNYENNKREPKFWILLKLADILQVSLDYLAGRSLNLENDSVLFMENIGFYCREATDGKIGVLLCENKIKFFSKRELDEIVNKARKTVSSLTSDIMIHEVLSCIMIHDVSSCINQALKNRDKSKIEE